MLNIGICEDRQEDQYRLRSALERILHSRGESLKISTYFSGEVMLEDIKEGYGDFSMLFLDVFMDGITGMEVAHRLRESGIKTPIIFLTTSPDFAVESYDVEAVGYLLKSLQEAKLQRLLERVLDRPQRPRVCVLSGRRYRYLFLDEIVFAESDNHSIRIHLVSGEVMGSSEKLKNFAARVDGRFLRCHQSFLVNMQYVADVKEDFVLKSGKIIPIRTRDRKAMADTYYRYFVQATLAERGGDH